MSGRVGKDARPVAVRLVFRLGRAEFQEYGLGLVEVIDREVNVKLLRGVLARA